MQIRVIGDVMVQNGQKDTLPIGYVCIHDAEIIQVRDKEPSCTMIRVKVENNKVWNDIEALESSALREWFDMDLTMRPLCELTICVPAVVRMYGATSNWSYIEPSKLRVGDRMSFQLNLRQSGYHTILENYQIFVYDCDCIRGDMFAILERNKSDPHDCIKAKDMLQDPLVL